jgi:hypothetical protein
VIVLNGFALVVARLARREHGRVEDDLRALVAIVERSF